jgi:hypothetical protein
LDWVNRPTPALPEIVSDEILERLAQEHAVANAVLMSSGRPVLFDPRKRSQRLVYGIVIANRQEGRGNQEDQSKNP